MAVLAALILAPWFLVALVLLSIVPPLSGRARRPVAGTRAAAGPWGNVEWSRVTIAAPIEFVETWDSLAAQPGWHFPNTTQTELEAVLRKAGLAEAAVRRLLEAARQDAAIEGWVVTPPDDIVWDLAPAVRGAIYNRLALSSLNKAHRDGPLFGGASVEEWFAGAMLRPATVDLVRRLAYRRGRFVCFSDFHLAARRLADDAERQRLLKVLARQATLLVKLRVAEGQDVEPLVRYWGRGGRAKDVGPLLESLARAPGGTAIDVAHLLPPLPRRYVYTYPTPPMDEVSANRDCHWTCLNFFADPPDDRYALLQAAQEALRHDYYPIRNDLALGDLVLFLDERNGVIHSAVFIADDILFTKSGSAPTNPWMFMRLEDMKDYYPAAKPLDIRFMRRKGL
jgi:hypothetical protein